MPREWLWVCIWNQSEWTSTGKSSKSKRGYYFSDIINLFFIAGCKWKYLSLKIGQQVQNNYGLKVLYTYMIENKVIYFPIWPNSFKLPLDWLNSIQNPFWVAFVLDGNVHGGNADESVDEIAPVVHKVLLLSQCFQCFF